VGSPVQTGERLFTDLACITCHRADATGRGPALRGVFGSQVALADGRTVVADEAYLRESIMQPAAKVVRGYQPTMPTFQGMVSEENLMRLVAYIKSLKPQGGAADTPQSGTAGK
jgi:cytochrome c oxidase subunit 2